MSHLTAMLMGVGLGASIVDAWHSRQQRKRIDALIRQIDSTYNDGAAMSKEGDPEGAERCLVYSRGLRDGALVLTGERSRT